MHAVVVTATIHDFDAARKGLDERIVPTVSQAPGFVRGYWTRSQGDSGLSMMVFESEEAARAVADRLESDGPPNPDAVTFESVEVREVVADA